MKFSTWYFRNNLTMREKYERLCCWHKPFNSPEFIKRLSFELFEWGHQPDALCLPQFLQDKVIPKSLYDIWLEEYPELRHIHEFVLICLAARRENGAATFKLNASVIMRTQWYYCDIWKESEEWHAKLKHGIEKAGNTIQVVMEPFAEAASVPQTVKPVITACKNTEMPDISVIGCQYNESEDADMLKPIIPASSDNYETTLH